jgi:hypothetical protein
MHGGHTRVHDRTDGGMENKTFFPLIYCRCMHGNRDIISLGPESAKLKSKRGDTHFWVIRHHEFSGVVCF